MIYTAEELKYIEPNTAHTLWYEMKRLNFSGKLHYIKIVLDAYISLNRFYKKALKDKECFYGPFKGEFGHFLLHNLPFISNLHKKGVKIHYCGMSLHKPFLVDEKGNSLIYKFYELRDFFSETPPSANQVLPPQDVCEEIDKFNKIARESGKPFLDISDNNLYWYVFRNWQLKKGRQSVYNIREVYRTKTENSCVIFPRKKGKSSTPNHGSMWDYMEIAKALSPYFDKIYITGHPTMSAELQSESNIEVRLSTDNKDILECCSNANLVITQHSGAVHVGIYTGTPVLLIFNGKPPISSLINTIRFRRNLTSEKINYAFTLDDIIDFARRRNKLS
ncbi:MAG: hypothetical protein J5I91_01700 [Bacteroidetes bacterium]|nr:hypothetical protein [Bacteroidota bacterium]